LGAAEIVERGIEVALGDGMHDVDFQPKQCGRCLRLRAVGYGIGIARIDQNADHAGGRQQAPQQLQLFRDQRVGEEAHAGNIAPRPIHADDEAELHGSAPIANTMGMLEVAALAASAAAVAPPVAITATRRATNSAARPADGRADCPPSGIQRRRSCPRRSRPH
jgi:hypothetical protein